MIVFQHFLLLIPFANCARILGIVPTPSYSHQIVFRSLWSELSLRGHQVTTITTHPIRDSTLTNLTEIDVGHFGNNFADYIDKATKTDRDHIIMEIVSYYERMAVMLDSYYGFPPVKELVNDPNVKFDLVIAEYFFPSVLAFTKRFNCPSIGMFSLDSWNTMYRMVGNPTHSSLYPDPLLAFEDRSSLVGRVSSFLTFHITNLLVDHMQRLEQKLVVKHFGEHYPSTHELARNISLLFVNSDPILHPIRPLVPTVVQIGGGFHRSSPKPLPKNVQNALDGAHNGFIYFSLGSNVKSEALPSYILDVFLSTFAELPYTVLWKFEDDNLPQKPNNVIISKWFAQQGVLKHPNIKLFITQGGLQSMDEAIYEHVPMIGIPFFGDQPYNVKKMVSKGFGLELDHKTLEKEQLKETILEVINNPKYRNTIKKLAELAQDQPMTGIEKAVWWTEYVIRHKGAKHLKSPLLDIPWYQYLLLDVIGVLVLSTLVIVYLVYFIIRKLVRLVKSQFLKKLVSREKKD